MKEYIFFFSFRHSCQQSGKCPKVVFITLFGFWRHRRQRRRRRLLYSTREPLNERQFLLYAIRPFETVDEDGNVYLRRRLDEMRARTQCMIDSIKNFNNKSHKFLITVTHST